MNITGSEHRQLAKSGASREHPSVNFVDKNVLLLRDLVHGTTVKGKIGSNVKTNITAGFFFLCGEKSHAKKSSKKKSCLGIQQC